MCICVYLSNTKRIKRAEDYSKCRIYNLLVNEKLNRSELLPTYLAYVN